MLLRTAAVFFLFAAPAVAANLPHKINFQGKLLDNDNAPVNGAVQLTLRLYTDPSTPVGSAPYLETQTGVPVSNGVFSVQIGSTAFLDPELFAGASVYLGIQVDADAEMTPRQQLVMSPYAFTAAQLSADQQARVRVGNAYSTFTATGDLFLSASVNASSGNFISGVVAGSGTFTATGASQYSLETTSGALIGGGSLQVDGSGGASVRYGVTASTFTGDGADILNTRPEVSSTTDNNAFNVASGVEVLVSSASVTPARQNSRFLVLGTVGLNRINNNLTTWSLRVRRNIGSACTVSSTQVGFTNAHTVPNTAGMSNLVTLFKIDAPNTTGAVWYCLTASPSGNQSMDERTLVVMELAP